jgi:membrane protein YqaA with SNARE-associated domain
MPGSNPGSRRLKLARILSLLAVVAISVFIFAIRDKAAQLAPYGYFGIFIISFMAYATVFLPAPGIAIVFAMGAVFNPLGVALAAGTGAALGELTGYLAGFSGQGVAERADIYERLSGWMRKYGPITVFFLAAIPNPFFDLAGLAAGALRVPIAKFLFWCWMGELIKMGAFAFLGAGASKWL